MRAASIDQPARRPDCQYSGIVIRRRTVASRNCYTLTTVTNATSALRHVIVIAASAVMTLLFLRPIWQLRAGIFGGITDGWMHVFHQWWMQKAFLTMQWPFFTPYLHHPTGAQMYWHTLALAKNVWGVMLLPLFGSVITYNLIVILTFVASCYTAWLFIRYVVRSAGMNGWIADVSAFCGSVIFAFSPYLLAHVRGHINLISVEGIPLVLLFYFRYRDTGSVRHLLLAGTFALYVLLCDYYYFVYVALFIVVDTLVRLLRSGTALTREALANRDVLRGLDVVLCIACFALPMFILLIWHAFPPPVNLFHGDADYFVDLLGLFAPHRLWYFFGALPQWLQGFSGLGALKDIEESGMYLGLVALAFAVFAVVTRVPMARRWAIIGAVFCSFSLGAFVSVAGVTTLRIWFLTLLVAVLLLFVYRRMRVPMIRDCAILLCIVAFADLLFPFTIEGVVTGLRIPGPYLVLRNILPFYDLAGMPVRFILMGYLALGVCAALGISAVLRWFRSAAVSYGVAAIVLVLLIVDFLPRGYAIVPFVPRPAEVIERIRSEPPGVAVLTDDTLLSQLEVVLHEHPVSTARLSRVPVHEIREKEKPEYDLFLRSRVPENFGAEELSSLMAFLRRHGFKYFIAQTQNPARDEFLVQRLGAKHLHSSPTWQAFQLYE